MSDVPANAVAKSEIRFKADFSHSERDFILMAMGAFIATQDPYHTAVVNDYNRREAFKIARKLNGEIQG